MCQNETDQRTCDRVKLVHKQSFQWLKMFNNIIKTDL